MAQMGRPGLSAAQKRELWQRWKAGQSLTEIGRAFEKHSSSIHLIALHFRRPVDFRLAISWKYRLALPLSLHCP
jgi:hypothetical protein